MNNEKDLAVKHEPGSGFVNAVADTLVVLTSFSLIGLVLMAILEAVVKLSGLGDAPIALGSWTLGVAITGLILWLARELRKRRNWARIGLIICFGSLAAYNTLWLATEWHLEMPLLGGLPFPQQNPGMYTIFMTALLAGVAFLLSGSTVRSQFGRR